MPRSSEDFRRPAGPARGAPARLRGRGAPLSGSGAPLSGSGRAARPARHANADVVAVIASEASGTHLENVVATTGRGSGKIARMCPGASGIGVGRCRGEALKERTPRERGPEVSTVLGLFGAFSQAPGAAGPGAHVPLDDFPS